MPLRKEVEELHFVAKQNRNASIASTDKHIEQFSLKSGFKIQYLLILIIIKSIIIINK